MITCSASGIYYKPQPVHNTTHSLPGFFRRVSEKSVGKRRKENSSNSEWEREREIRWKVNLQFSNFSTIAVADFAHCHYFVVVVVVVRPKPTKSSDADWHWPSTQHLNATTPPGVPSSPSAFFLRLLRRLVFLIYSTGLADDHFLLLLLRFVHYFHQSTASLRLQYFSPPSLLYYSCFTFFFVASDSPNLSLLLICCVWLSSLFPLIR